MLANKEEKEDYYGKTGRWKHKIDEELEDFGFTLEPEGNVKKPTQGHGAPEMRGRNVGEDTIKLTGEKKELLENQERTVAGLNISHLLETEKPRKAKGSRRLFQIPKEEGLVEPILSRRPNRTPSVEISIFNSLSYLLGGVKLESKDELNFKISLKWLFFADRENIVI